MGAKWHVRWGERVNRELDRIPAYIRDKFLDWAHSVEIRGMEETRKLPGFHDEKLVGPLRGSRSVRLNRAYRALYVELDAEGLKIALVRRVGKHDYSK